MTHSSLKIFHKKEARVDGNGHSGQSPPDYPGLHHLPRRGRKVASRYSRYSPRIDAAIYLPSRPRWYRNGQSLRPKRWIARSIELRSAILTTSRQKIHKSLPCGA